MKQFEQQFEERLSALDKDSASTATFLYTMLSLDYFFSGDFDVRDRINPHAGFWNGILASLQSSTFIGLGRLYDKDGRAHTIDSLLDFASGNSGIFCPSALEKRKAALGSTQAREFAAGTVTLAHLWREFETFRALYVAKVQPVRHNVFAHRRKIDQEQVERLFAGIFLRELEQLVVFPIRLYRALAGLYHGGKEPILESPPTILTDVLKATPDAWTSTWEHLHVAKHAAGFVEWLKLAPVPEKNEVERWVEELKRHMENPTSPTPPAT